MHDVMGRLLGSSNQNFFFPDGDSEPGQVKAMQEIEAGFLAAADVPPAPLSAEAEAAFFGEIAAAV